MLIAIAMILNNMCEIWSHDLPEQIAAGQHSTLLIQSAILI